MRKLLTLATVALIPMFFLIALQWNQIDDLREDLTTSYQRHNEAVTEVLSLRVDVSALRLLSDAQRATVMWQEGTIVNLEAQADKYKTLYEQRYQPDPEELRKQFKFIIAVQSSQTRNYLSTCYEFH